ncbi:hypothetical protein BU15DRAFT_64532 [Melanogaster broomeanus]|nr:hypothetical protein BU15DRAFT_68815 [Melanogaster broomeanus]KAF9235774.1 hypothetical protein BU15DRAFT_64532 [Melanogaster broomeanus]
MINSIFTDLYPDECDDPVMLGDASTHSDTPGEGDDTIVVVEVSQPSDLESLEVVILPPATRSHLLTHSNLRWLCAAAAPLPPQNVLISCTIIMYSYREMKKPKPKREGETAMVKLSSDEPFDTLKAQILKVISEALNPKLLAYDDYKITSFVIRLSFLTEIPTHASSRWIVV